MKLRIMLLAGHVTRRGIMRNTYGILIWGPERKKPFGNSRRG
jgi:hypothetical protein